MSTSLHPSRFKSQEVVIPKDTIYDNDKLNREPFISAVSDLLRSIQEPFVVALDAPWGSGKTTTFRMLEQQLTNADIVTVSFNAWEVDYATDPLVPLVATLHDRLLQIKGYDNSLDSSKVEKFKALGGILAKHAAVAGVKALTAGLVDVSGLADGVGKAIGDAADKAGEGLTGDLIDYFKQEKKAANQFKELLEELTNYVRKTTTEGELPPPVVLMIDELDRCRPTFAVAMLERIKHFFNIPGLVFVLALDTKQLKASTQKVYGAEMDASEYLRRFVDLELRLPRADAGQMIESMLSACGVDAFFAARNMHYSMQSDRSQMVVTLKELASIFELPPRVVQRMVSRVVLIIRQTRVNQHLDSTVTAFLVFLRLTHPDIYRSIVSGRVSPNEAIRSVQLLAPSNRSFYYSPTGELMEAFLLLCSSSRFRDQGENYRRLFVQDVKALKSDAGDPESARVRKVAGLYNSIKDVLGSRDTIALDLIDSRINLVAEEFDSMR
ncbi:KAP family P-loop NTPase fold protein [Diaphorobacter caeni]|uniref:KAP family P-loop NTPase fold protein n=1 Tax=Diaphorobacter caeni TaxID=2784387 RepID=UPI00188DCB15|nr:P-loop NTPase fold protein [Diaphorobacter caeni]MBF5006387.1 hypothetical protein [Diaphorobacter caeni]